eukprot:TRINITY_DN104607_c0_g1_i1.p1 TRINITY_DN104607_c0_g1~~TRINITY_DN104607_c0_g1_i1.p1  ORF type:complete len:258 (+),score=26.98 TRINITY_DN104607_c0_g1_i1:27-800(+)
MLKCCRGLVYRRGSAWAGRRKCSTTPHNNNLDKLIETECVFRLRGYLEKHPKRQVKTEEFKDLCVKSGIDPVSVPQILDSFERAAVIVRLDANDNTVIIKPETVFNELHDLLRINYDPNEKDTIALGEVEQKLAELEKQKAPLDYAVGQNVSTWFAAGGAGVALLMAGMARLTFVDFDWDVMEPATYFITSGAATLMFGWYAWNKEEYTYTNLQQRMVNKRRTRKYIKAGFPVSDYMATIKRRDELKAKLNAAKHFV